MDSTDYDAQRTRYRFHASQVPGPDRGLYHEDCPATSGVNVDSIQSGNVVKVAACEGYALLLRDMASATTGRSLEKQFEEAEATSKPAELQMPELAVAH